MMTSTATRRVFVGGAVALGAIALLPIEGGGSEDDIAAWTAVIGRRFRLSVNGSNEHAVLTDVVAGRHRGTVAAPIRSQPFRLRFALDEAEAAGVDGIYALDHPVAGVREVFLTHGHDRAGRAVLSAVFG